MLKRIGTAFDRDAGIVVSHLQGQITAEDVALWRTGLLRCVREARAASGGSSSERLKLLVDTRHYAPASLAAHRAYRDTLAEVEAEVAGHILVAFVHHDAYKMEQMQASAEAGTGYFTEVEDARYWLAPA